MLLAVAGYPIPNLTNVRDYADLLQEKLVGESEQAGRQNEARSYYWTVAHFGERVQPGSATEIERLIAAALQAKAYERLLPLLRRLGESDEAATVEFASQQARRSMTADRAPREYPPREGVTSGEQFVLDGADDAALYEAGRALRLVQPAVPRLCWRQALGARAKRRMAGSLPHSRT